VTVTVPGETPAVAKVAEDPFPVTEAPLALQFATETGTPSGLVQFAVNVTGTPCVALEGSAVMLIVGGFFGGSGLMV
jgi:hypothetical protein